MYYANVIIEALIITVILAYTQENNLEENLSMIFPENYDKFQQPSVDGQPAHVYISINILDVDNIDEGKMEYSVMLYMREWWKDDRLNLTSFRVNHNEPPIFPSYLVPYIWVPDLVFDNTKDGKLFHLSLPNTAIKVSKQGSFWKTSRYNLLVSCPMDFHFYPMDTQRCYLKIATLSNPDSKVLLHWSEEYNAEEEQREKSIILLYYVKPLKYVLREIKSYKESEAWPDGNYTFLYANFTFVRRLSGAVFNVYIPSTMVVLLSWISFWVDVEAVPARITLGVTSLLTLTTQVVQAHSGLPPISYMTAMDIWLFACLIAVFSVLLEFAFAYQIFIFSNQRSITDEESNAGINLGAKRDGYIVRARLGQNLALRGPGRFNSINNLKTAASNRNKYLDKICRSIFPVLFILFSVVYWVYFLNST